MSLFEVESFIAKVQDYPELYDTQHANYKNNALKQTKWLEIAQYFSTNWETLSKQQRKSDGEKKRDV